MRSLAFSSAPPGATAASPLRVKSARNRTSAAMENRTCRDRSHFVQLTLIVVSWPARCASATSVSNISERRNVQSYGWMEGDDGLTATQPGQHRGVWRFLSLRDGEDASSHGSVGRVTASALVHSRSCILHCGTDTQNERRARRTVRWVVGGSPPAPLPAGEAAGLWMPVSRR